MGKSCLTNKADTLHHRVTLQVMTTVTDDQGGQVPTWADVSDLWAKIEPIKAWEKMQAAQLQTPVTHKVLLRYNSAVTNKHRLLFGTRVMNIKEVINVEELNEWLECRVIEIQT